MRCVHDRRPRAEAAGAGEELDRAHAVLGDALLDLARLLVGVDVEREPLRGGVAPDLLEPVGGTGADGVGGKPDPHTAGAERLDLLEVGRGRLLAKAGEPPAGVGREQEHELDPGASAAASTAASASSKPR